jgi:hypothetical protein
MITLRDLTWFSLASSDYGSNDTLPTFSALTRLAWCEGFGR